MFTISDILKDIDRGCMLHNMLEDRFSYRIVYFVNENDIGRKYYADTSYNDLRKTLENIIRNNLSLENCVVITQTTVRKNGKCMCLQSRSYRFSLDGYFEQIVGRKEKEYKNTNYVRKKVNVC